MVCAFGAENPYGVQFESYSDNYLYMLYVHFIHLQRSSTHFDPYTCVAALLNTVNQQFLFSTTVLVKFSQNFLFSTFCQRLLLVVFCLNEQQCWWWQKMRSRSLYWNQYFVNKYKTVPLPSTILLLKRQTSHSLFNKIPEIVVAANEFN